MPLEKTREISGTLSNELEITGSIDTLKNVKGSLSTPTEKIVPGDYDKLRNKPSIENVTLQGNKTIDQIGVGTMTVQEIEKILYLD